jgi:hypothetical protein
MIDTEMQELLDTAARHRNMYLGGFQRNFAEKYHRPINLLSGARLRTGWEALRSVTLSAAVKYQNSALLTPGFRHRLDIDVNAWDPLDPLRRLLERPFDKVTLLFTCPEVESAPIEHEVTNSIWHHLMEMHTDIGTVIGEDWSRFLWADDIDKLRQYRQNPSLVLPHLKYDGDQCCHKCSVDCLSYDECLHPDDCDTETCRDHCSGKCDSKDPECDWGHRVLSCNLAGVCKYSADEHRSECGPKRRDYNSADEHRFARAQWNRLCSSRVLGSRSVNYGEDPKDAHTLKRIQTKEIRFAWDYRCSKEPVGGDLLGERQRYLQTRVEALAHEDSLRVPEDDEEYDKEWPYACYLDLEGWDGMLNNDSLAGMWVIGHPKRWMLTSREVLDEEDMDDGMGLGLTNGRKERVVCTSIGNQIVARTTEAIPWPGLSP